ncbi:hypothetical protein KM427_16100 [Nocardioides sp. LMS-CY]|nr:hypothetical protein [Nocardioides sp. LMS-CY]QWF20501.1 hypothetical protein KM427_16100 [Nocardioides sp. LMS-CY]
MTINVTLDRATVSIDREVFAALFEQSVVHDYEPIRKALNSGTMPFRELVRMARQAEIPYPLFFAPRDVVVEQLRMKTEALMVGFGKKTAFAMNSRNTVRIHEVELIVKDLLRKQEYLKTDKALPKNPVVNCLKLPGVSARADAAKLMGLINLSPTDLRNTKNKGDALALLVEKLEAQHVLVAQSAKNYMPQQMPKGARFSGMTVKDNKVPYIFIASGDEGEKYEPAGRRVFTLALLAVLVARGTFATVTYKDHTSDETTFREWEITAELLMPAADFKHADLSTLDAVRDTSDVFKVTPSAVVTRARRLNILGKQEADRYLEELRIAYERGGNPPRRAAKGLKALRKYNGVECSRRMLALYDAQGVSRGDFCRVMFSNKFRGAQSINDYRALVA